MASTSQPMATAAAVHIMRLGGSAVDAAIAANAVLMVAEPFSASVGGDLTALVWQGGELHGLNATGRSGGGVDLAAMRRRVADYPTDAWQPPMAMPSHGPLPITVPGCVDGWFELHKKWGKLPMSTVLQPAVDHAREGIVVHDVCAAGFHQHAQRYANGYDVMM